MPATEVILALQELLLRAVLLSQTLPGHATPLQLPDLSFILRQPEIYLADENLAGDLSATDLGKPLCILTELQVKQRARQQGDTAYLQFLESKAKNGEVRLTLAAKIAAKDPDKHPLGLSSVQVIFHKTGSGWEAVESPVYSAF